jgi:Flp pilus assembly protein TadG
MSNQFAWRYRLREKRAGGQSLVEVALILPMLALLLIGAVEFGFLLYAQVQVANAAREAARAGSLYRSTRYTYADTKKNCDGAIAGWSLQNVVDQAVVTLPLDAQGCRNTSAAPTYTSLGWLDPAPASPDVIQVTISDVEANTSIPTTVFWTTSQQSGAVVPDAGKRATVTVVYPYRLVVVSNLLPYLTNPISIGKSVRFEFSQ